MARTATKAKKPIKSRMVSVRVDTALYEYIEEQATLEDRPIAWWLRRLMTKAILQYQQESRHTNKAVGA